MATLLNTLTAWLYPAPAQPRPCATRVLLASTTDRADRAIIREWVGRC